MVADDDLLAIGRITKAFGVQGEVVLEPLADDVARFRRLRVAYLGRSPDVTRKVTVHVTSVEPRGVRLRIEGTETRTQAEELKGSYLFVDRLHRRAVRRGTYFVSDIVGLSVKGEDGVYYGIVKDVLKMPAQDVYVVDRDGKEILIPAVREFIRAVDLKGGVITVRLIEGMQGEE